MNLSTRTNGAGTFVGAYFATATAADAAVQALKGAGFAAERINCERGNGARQQASAEGEADGSPGLAAKADEHALKSFFEGDDAVASGDAETSDLEMRRERRIRALSGFPHSLSAGEYRDPDFRDDGPIATAHDDADAGSTRGLGISFPEACLRFFGDEMRGSDGGAIVTVRVDEREVEAEAVIVRHGGEIGTVTGTL